MLLKRLNRDEPERVFIVVENNEGAQMDKDSTCQLDLTTDVDGVKARDVDQHEQYAFLGVVDANLADGDFGLVQVYGYRSSSNVVRTNTNLSAGMVLAPVTGVHHFAQVGTAAATALAAVWAVAAESSTSGTGSSTPKIFIRAL
ncbi:MAG: hypothetical protein ACR2QC_11895 [Gammaproteobacteria bacterium]